MANARFEKTFRAALTDRAVNLLSGTIVGQLIDTAVYTPDFTNHRFLSSVPAGARLGSPFTLSSKTLSDDNVFGAADVSNHPLGAAITASGEAILILENTGSDATSQLILWLDTDAGGAIAVPAGRTHLSCTWSTGANKIMKV